MPNKTDPITPDELSAAADLFFPLFDIVQSRAPEGSSTKDCLEILEAITKLAQATRKQDREDKAAERFGFLQLQQQPQES